MQAQSVGTPLFASKWLPTYYLQYHYCSAALAYQIGAHHIETRSRISNLDHPEKKEKRKRKARAHIR